MTALLPQDMCVQLGRYWSERTSVTGGLTFVEADDATPGNLYAAPLPKLAHRLESGVSITVVNGPPMDRQSSLENIAIRIEAHAADRATAMALAIDLRDVFWSSGSQFVHIETLESGERVPGLIGRPPVDPEDLSAWRIVTAEVLTDPIIVPGPVEGRSFDGQAVAAIEILLSVVPFEIPGSPTAFSVYRDFASGSPTVRVFSDRLELRLSQLSATDFDFATHPTLGDLRAAVNGFQSWVTADVDESFDARSSSDLFELGTTPALGETNKVPLRLAAA